MPLQPARHFCSTFVSAAQTPIYDTKREGNPSHETYSLRLDVRFRRFRIDGRTSLPSIRSVEPVIMPGSASGLERRQGLDDFRRLRTDRVVRVHFGFTDDSFPVDHVPRGHGQSVLRFVVEPVQGDAEGLVKVAQVIRQYKSKPKLLCGPEVKIRQDVEGQVELLMHVARIPFEFRSERRD